MLAWLSTGLNVLAGIFLAIPALRLSRHLLQLDRLERPRGIESEALEGLRSDYLEAMGRALGRWDRRDHLMLWVGFVCLIGGALVDLAELAGAA